MFCASWTQTENKHKYKSALTGKITPNNNDKPLLTIPNQTNKISNRIQSLFDS